MNLKQIFYTLVFVLVAVQGWAADYYVWEDNTTEYYSSVGFEQSGTSNANALDYVIDSVMSNGDTVYVGNNVTTNSDASYGIRLVLTGVKNIIKTTNISYNTGDITLTSLGNYFMYNSSAVDGMTIQGPFIADDSANSGEFWFSGAAIQNCTFKDIIFQNFNTATILDIGDGVSTSTFEDITVKQSDVLIFDDSPASTTNTFKNITIYYDNGVTDYLYFDGESYTFEYPIFYGNADDVAIKFRGLSGASARSHNLIYPKYLDWYDADGNYVKSGSLQLQDYGGSGLTVNEYNGVHVNPEDYAWEAVVTGTIINVYNSVGVGLLANEDSGGEINIDSSYLLKDWMSSATDGTVTDSITIDSTNTKLLFNQHAPGYAAIIPCMDDLENALDPSGSDQVPVIEEWIAEGITGVLYIQPGSSADVENGVTFTGDELSNFNTVVGYVNAGQVDVGPHTMSHISLAETVAFDIKKAASIDAETATCTVSATSFSIDCTDNDADISLTFGSGGIDSLYDVYDYLNTNAYYTVANPSYGATTSNGQKQTPTVLTATSFAVPASGASATDIEYDMDAKFEWEIGQAKTWLLTNFTQLESSDIRSMAAPSGDTPNSFITYLNDNETDTDIGILFNRGSKPTGEPGYNGSSYDLRDYNTKLTQVVEWTNWAGGNVADYIGGTITDASIKARGAAMAEYCKVAGIVLMPYSHNTQTEANVAMWSAFIEGVKSVDAGLFKPIDTVIDYIRSGTQDVTNSEVWSVDFSTNYTFNFKTGGGSSLVNAGNDAVILYGEPDVDGEYMYREYNIGPSQKAGAPSGGSKKHCIGCDGIGM